ncbi:1-phosphatidylinositol phosphodiesterase [Ceratocystis lukuohia]|uniref:1-phosphatidylinositol phosphodiesterase n=1 Tax=Ceratocystis lukuohia TaxID=2019550 RepID=A0ABR4MA17_9PEZI
MRFSLLANIAFLALTHAGSYNHVDDPWSFDVNDGSYADWMYYIADNTPLSSLSIPGTHNSMTYNMDNYYLEGQNVPLAKQLAGGIRYLDITCLPVGDKLMVYHGLHETGYSLEDALAPIYNFLHRHPHEAVILRLQRSSSLERTKVFTDLLRKYLTPETVIGSYADKYVYNRGGAKITTLPTLGEIRGKLFILQDFGSKPSGVFGLPWSSPLISSYHCKLGIGKLLVGVKWLVLKSYIRSLSGRSSKKLYITDVTVSFGSRPIDVAAGDRADAGINSYLGTYLESVTANHFGEFFLNGNRARIGIISMDFPGYKLVEQILKFNNIYQVIPLGGIGYPSYY